MSQSRVYIVDDDSSVRDSLELLLKASGYDVRSFASGNELLKAIPSLSFGCLIIDVRMPDIDGLELQRRLAELNATLPVVVITGYGDVATAVSAMKAGAVDFVEKPFSKDAIVGSVELALNHRPRSPVDNREREAIEKRLGLLSPREREVLDGLIAGQPNKVIAYNLSLSIRTVEIHRARVMDKMQAGSLSELVRFAINAGIEPASNRRV
jgi:two-component system response regulator FixJ